MSKITDRPEDTEQRVVDEVIVRQRGKFTDADVARIRGTVAA